MFCKFNHFFTFKKLDTELGTLPEGGQNRRSRRGKEIFAIKEKGGVPVIAGRDKNGKIIEDKVECVLITLLFLIKV